MAEPSNQISLPAEPGKSEDSYALRVDSYDETVYPFRKNYTHTVYPNSKSPPKPSHMTTVAASLLTVWDGENISCIFVHRDYDNDLPEHDERVNVFEIKGPSIVIEYTHGDVGRYHFSVSPGKEEPPVEYDEFKMWYNIEKEKWEPKT